MTFEDFFLSFTHPPIVPFFSLSAFPHSNFISYFTPSNPLCPVFNSSPHVLHTLCTSRISQNVPFTTPNPFIPCSFPPHPPFCFPALFYYFFPSLHTHAYSSDSHFTVIYGNPFPKSSSQRQSSSLHPHPHHSSSSTPRLISPPLD